MQLLLPAAYTAVFIYAIYKFSFFDCEGLSKKLIVFIFLLKLAFGTAVWAIYTYYYTNRLTADIFKYFDDSRIIYDAIKTNPADYFKILFGINNDNAYFDENYYHKMNFWSKSSTTYMYNESHTIIRFNAFIHLFSIGNYHVHTVFMCFLSLLGLVGIYKTFVSSLSDKKNELVLIVFFLPSMLLWSSGVLKEGLLIFALGMVIYFMKMIVDGSKKRILWILFLVLSLYLLVLIKFYAIAAIIPCMIAWAWCSLTKHKHTALKFIIVHAVYIAYLLSLNHLNDFYNVPQMLALKQQEFIKLAKEQNAKSFINIPILEANLQSIIANSPLALFNTIVRPHPLEAKSPFILIAALENILLVGFIILAFYTNRLKKFNAPPLFYLALFFSVLMMIVIGLTTPIMGAMVRYRSIALPFFLILFLFIYNKEKLPSYFIRIKNLWASKSIKINS